MRAACPPAADLRETGEAARPPAGRGGGELCPAAADCAGPVARKARGAFPLAPGKRALSRMPPEAGGVSIGAPERRTFPPEGGAFRVPPEARSGRKGPVRRRFPSTPAGRSEGREASEGRGSGGAGPVLPADFPAEACAGSSIFPKPGFLPEPGSRRTTAVRRFAWSGSGSVFGRPRGGTRPGRPAARQGRGRPHVAEPPSRGGPGFGRADRRGGRGGVR